MAFRVCGALILTAAVAAGAACGGSSPESQPASTAAPAAAPAADHSGHAGGKVFFKEPANGAMVKSPVHLVFGSDMFTIAPVPEGEVTTVRANTGHYHLGVDTDCLSAGWFVDSQSEPVVPLWQGERQHRHAAHAGTAQAGRAGWR